MALSKALSLTLEALLERCATRAAAAETAAAKPNLTKAAEVAAREFGTGTGHHKAIVHILCALEGQDPAIYMWSGYRAGDFVVLKSHLNSACALHLNEVGLIINDPDSDTDTRVIGVWNRYAPGTPNAGEGVAEGTNPADAEAEAGKLVPWAHCFRTTDSTDMVRLKNGEWRFATLEEARGLVERFNLLDEAAANAPTKCIRALRSRIISCLDA